VGEVVENKSWMSWSLQCQVELVPGSLDQVFEYCKVWYMTEHLITGKLGNHRLM